jgi:hypothetical protein
MLIADTHVHIYPCHDPARTLDAGYDHLSRLLPATEDATRILCLTERHDCHFFEALKRDSAPIGASQWRSRPLDENGSVCMQADDGRTLYVVAGRQIVTGERLEVLALGTNAAFTDGQPIAGALHAVSEAGGLPVVAWSPGKWFFERGRIIKSLIETSAPDSFVLGDTTLRPIGWPTPRLMQQAQEKGFKTVAGSDPLPFAGEETRSGRYGVIADVSVDSNAPFAGLCAAIVDGRTRIVGARSMPWDMLARLFRNARSKRGGSANG